MAQATEALVLISGSSIDIDTNAGEGSGKGFSGHTNAIWKFGDLIKFCGILESMSRCRHGSVKRGGVPFVEDLLLSQTPLRPTLAFAL